MSASVEQPVEGGSAKASLAREAWPYIRLALGAFLLIFCSGFGVMVTLWCLYSGHATLGLTHYRAATFGDGFFVPYLVASLVCIHRYLQRITNAPISRLVVAAAGAAGMVGSVGLQASWLVDPNPQLNWSLPRVHHFAASGWYHACFLVVAVTVVSALLAAVGQQLRRARSHESVLLIAVERHGLFEFCLFPGWTFCFLVALDGGQGSSEAFTIAGALLLVALTTIALLIISTPRLRLAAIRPLCVSIIAAAGISFALERWPAVPASDLAYGLTLVVLIAASDSIRVSVPQRVNRISKAIATACGGLALIVVPEGLQLALSIRIILVILMCPLSLLLELFDTPPLGVAAATKRAFPWIIALSIPLSDYLEAQGERAALTGSFIFIVAGITLGRSLLPLLREEWEEFVHLENAAGLGHNTKRSAFAKRIVARVTLLALACLVSFVRLGFAIAPSLGFVLGHGGVSLPWFVIVPALLVCGIAITQLVKRLTPRQPTRGPLGPVFAAAVICVVAGGVDSALSANWRPSIIIVIFQVSIVFLWQMESIIGNALMRNLLIPRARIVAVAGGASIAIAIVAYWIGTSSEEGPDGRTAFAGWSLLALVGGSLTILAIAFIAGRMLDPPSTDHQVPRAGDKVAHYRLTSGLLQDAGLMTLLIAGVVWMTSMTIVHIPVGSHERTAAILTFLTSIFLFYTSTFKWTLRNNTKNALRFQRLTGRARSKPVLDGLLPLALPDSYGRMRDGWRSAKRPEEIAADQHRANRHFSEILDAHITNQNFIAMVALVITVAGVFGLLNERGDE